MARAPISPTDGVRIDELTVPAYMIIGVTRAVCSVEGEAFFRLFQAWDKARSAAKPPLIGATNGRRPFKSGTRDKKPGCGSFPKG